MTESPKKGGPTRALSYLAGAVAALALFVTNLETLQKWWCDQIGAFCPAKDDWVRSDTVYVFSGGTRDNKSDECKTHSAEACVRSSPKMQLEPETARFVSSERSGGVYLNGKPSKPDPIGTHNIGWFLESQKTSPREVCATVFARTGACETKVFLSGQLAVHEISK